MLFLFDDRTFVKPLPFTVGGTGRVSWQDKT